jgi:hypothetical protein
VGNTRARRTNTAKRAPNMPMHHRHVPLPVCAISILWNLHTNPYRFQSNNELKQQGDGAGETSITTNYELQGTGWATRAPDAQTLQSVRQTCICTTATCLYLFVRFPSCGIFTPTRTIPVKQRVEPQVTVTVKPQERQITSCMARGGQHVHPSHKHCKPCAKDAHAPRPRAFTCTLAASGFVWLCQPKS